MKANTSTGITGFTTSIGITGFTFQRAYFNAVQKMQKAERCAFYDALFSYVFKGEEVAVSGTVEILMTALKPGIDAACKRSADGRNGGRPSKAGRTA